jgi:hypothetical protein
MAVDLGKIILDWEEKQKQNQASLNEQLSAKQDDQLQILGQIVNQNPVAASGLKGAQKATEEMSYEAVKSGAKDVNEVLSDLVAKFGGGAVTAQEAPASGTDLSIKSPNAEPMAPAQEPVVQPDKPQSELQSAAMELVKGQSEKLPLFERMQRGALLSMGIDPDDAMKGLGGKTKQLANIKTAQEIMGETPAQAKDIAMKVLEFKLKSGEEKNLKPEQILNKFEPVC